MRINYNVTGSRRKELVRAIAGILGKPAIYLGAPTFAYQIGDYQVDKDGVLTYSDQTDLMALENLRAALLLEGYSAESDPKPEPARENYSCMVEMPQTGFTPEAEARLEKIIASKATLLKKALDTDTLEIVKTETTYQFPWFTLHNLDGEVEAYHRLICALCKMAKEQRRVTATEQPTDNEKFSMRIFLIRLGFVGSEYKVARKILLRNLSGNSSWKAGHRPGQTTAATEPAPDTGSTETIPADTSADEEGGTPDVQ